MPLKHLCTERNGELTVAFYTKTELTNFLDMRRVCYYIVRHIDEYRKKFLVDISPIKVIFRSRVTNSQLLKNIIFSAGGDYGCVRKEYFLFGHRVLSIFLDSIISEVLNFNLQKRVGVSDQEITSLLQSPKIVERIANLSKNVLIHESVHLLRLPKIYPNDRFNGKLKGVSGKKLFKEIKGALPSWRWPYKIEIGLKSLCYLYSKIIKIYIDVLEEGAAMLLERYYLDVDEDTIFKDHDSMCKGLQPNCGKFNSFLEGFLHTYSDIVNLLVEKAVHDEVRPMDLFWDYDDFEKLESYFVQIHNFIYKFRKKINPYVMGEVILRFVLSFSKHSFKELLSLDIEDFYVEYERIALSKSQRPILGFSNEALLSLSFIEEKLSILLNFPRLLKEKYNEHLKQN